MHVIWKIIQMPINRLFTDENPTFSERDILRKTRRNILAVATLSTAIFSSTNPLTKKRVHWILDFHLRMSTE